MCGVSGVMCEKKRGTKKEWVRERACATCATCVSFYVCCVCVVCISLELNRAINDLVFVHTKKI